MTVWAYFNHLKYEKCSWLFSWNFLCKKLMILGFYRLKKSHPSPEIWSFEDCQKNQIFFKYFVDIQEWIGWICTKYLKKVDFYNNLKKTIFLDWDVIFSICKNLKSSDFYGEYFRKTFNHIFHTFGVSSKPKREKIRNFLPKILLWIEIFSNRGLLWLYGVWQNKAQRVPEHLQRVSLLDKFFIIICVKGRCVLYQ